MKIGLKGKDSRRIPQRFLVNSDRIGSRTVIDDFFIDLIFHEPLAMDHDSWDAEGRSRTEPYKSCRATAKFVCQNNIRNNLSPWLLYVIFEEIDGQKSISSRPIYGPKLFFVFKNEIMDR